MPSGASDKLVLLLALLATPARARAQSAEAPAPAPRARLVYVVAPDAEACPSADEFRAAVDARAGRALFGEPATVTLEVRLRRAGTAHVATVDLPGAPGAATRELRSDVGCAELATAAALVASIAIDPASILAPPAPPPTPPAVAPRTWRGLVGLGPRFVSGLTPDATPGLALTGALIGARGTLGLELTGLWPRETAHREGAATIAPLLASLLPCASRGHWEACGVARFGLLRGAGAGFTENLSTWKAFGGLGARGGWTTDLGRLRVRAFFEAALALPRTTFLVSAAEVYATRGVTLAVGVDGLLLF